MIFTNSAKTGDRVGAATVLLLGLWMLTHGAKQSVATTTFLLLLICCPAGAVRQPPPNHNPNLQPHAQQTHASAAKIRRPDTRSTAPHISTGTAPWGSGGVASDTAMRRFRAALHQARPQVAPLNPIIPPNGNLGLATPANAAPPRLPAIAEGSNELSTGRPAGGALNQGGIRAVVVNLFGVAGADAADDFPVIMDDGDLNQTQPWNEGDDQGEIDDDLLDNNQLDATIDEDQAANAEDQLAEMIRRNEEILRELEEAREAAALARADAEAARLLLQRQQDAAAHHDRSPGGRPAGAAGAQGAEVASWTMAIDSQRNSCGCHQNADGARRPNVNPHLVQPRVAPVLVLGGIPPILPHSPLLPLPQGPVHVPPVIQQTSFEQLTSLVSNIRNQLILRPQEDIMNFSDAFRRIMRNALREQTARAWPTCSVVDGLIIGTRLHLDETSANDLPIIQNMNLQTVHEIGTATDSNGNVVNTFDMTSVAAAITLEREGVLLADPLRQPTFSFPTIPLGHFRADNHGFRRNTIYINFGHGYLADLLIRLVLMAGAIGHDINNVRRRIMAWFDNGNNLVIIARMLNGAFLEGNQISVTKK